MTHLDQIQRAVDFIETRLREELPIEEVAKVAGFSMWHFQRVFSGAVGDTVKEYVRSRRLSQAMQELVATERRIIDIALDFQFESQESFTRAFKAMYKLNPGEFRKQGVRSGLSPIKPRITFEYLDHLYGGMTMQPKFTTLDEKKIVGLSTHFISILSADKNNHVVIPELWQNYLTRTGEIKNRLSPHSIGICEAISEPKVKTHPEECFYMAGAEVSNLDSVPPGMTAKVLPAGRYAIFTHRGKLDTLEHTMNYIYGSWLPKSGEKLRDAPDLEVYDDRFKFGHDDSEVDLYIPIE